MKRHPFLAGILALLAVVVPTLPVAWPVRGDADHTLSAAWAQQVWYIAGETGDDANSGLAPAAPRRTFPMDGSITTGDSFNVAENCRSRLVASGKAVHVGQWQGQPQALLRGGIEETSGWTQVGSTHAWQKNIGGEKALNNTESANDAGAANTGGVWHNWDVKVNADGQHFGMMTYDTRANVEASAGTGKYHYDTTSGILTVNLGGPSPNAAGQTVEWCDVAGGSAITVSNGSGSTFRGLKFAMYPTSKLGYAIRLANCVGATTSVQDCEAYDMGAHAFGATGTCKNITFLNCLSKGLNHDGTHVVFHTADNNTTVTGCVANNMKVLGARWRNFEDSGVPAGVGAMNQTGVFAHGPGGGLPVTDVEVRGGTFTHKEALTPVDIGDAPAPSDGWRWATYGGRVTGMVVVNGVSNRPAGNVAFRQCIFNMNQSGSSGVNGIGSVGCIGFGAAVANTQLYESCAFIFDSDGTPSCIQFKVWSAGQDLRLLNASVHDSASATGQGSITFSWNSLNTAFIRIRGCAIELSGAASNALCWEDGTTDATTHRDFRDIAYKGVPATLWSENSALNSQAEWTTSVDSYALIETGTMFPNAPAALSLTQNSVIWHDRRKTKAIVPTGGLPFGFGSYIGQYGAYQYPRVLTHRRR